MLLGNTILCEFLADCVLNKPKGSLLNVVLQPATVNPVEIFDFAIQHNNVAAKCKLKTLHTKHMMRVFLKITLPHINKVPKLCFEVLNY